MFCIDLIGRNNKNSDYSQDNFKSGVDQSFKIYIHKYKVMNKSLTLKMRKQVTPKQNKTKEFGRIYF